MGFRSTSPTFGVPARLSFLLSFWSFFSAIFLGTHITQLHIQLFCLFWGRVSQVEHGRTPEKLKKNLGLDRFAGTAVKDTTVQYFLGFPKKCRPDVLVLPSEIQ